MKSWRLDRLGGELRLKERPVPEARPGSVLVRIEASTLMTYLKAYVEGRLPIYNAPKQEFTPGGNGIGTVTAVGRDVWHVRPGQRVVISSHLVAGENVEDPAQFLLGVTAFGALAEAMQADWPDGTLAEYALVPKAAVTPIDGLDDLTPAELASLARYVVPFGGLIRGRVVAGETVGVVGAGGAYGSAAVRLAVALGAERVIAIGRRKEPLDALARTIGSRVVPIALRGEASADVNALRSAAGGGLNMILDMVGGATDASSTLTALRSLHRNGRLVLMGSMSVPVPVPYLDLMANNWEILGNFMYPATTYARLFSLVRAGLLDARAIRPRAFPFEDLPAAIEAAASAANDECVVVTS
ncbi:MAG TPA: zinc-binding dehydrogenase [Kofleriaceae bacterium]|jgi:alcohol dehydrogenase|nr:zinc-binding dehydrogenase [Kofleriaceae bacterium]